MGKKYGKGSTQWAKGSGTSEHEPWAKERDGSRPHRRARFSASTKGIRLRPEQIEWVNNEIAKDPEETWSRLVRRGIDLVKKEREGLIRLLSQDVEFHKKF